MVKKILEKGITFYQKRFDINAFHTLTRSIINTIAAIINSNKCQLRL